MIFRNKKAVESRSFLRNKKADIAITILVIAVVVLCAVALFSFYAGRGKIGSRVNSALFLQDAYNLAESMRYSGINLAKSYDNNVYDADYDANEGKFILERIFYKKDFGMKGDDEVLKVKYVFGP